MSHRPRNLKGRGGAQAGSAQKKTSYENGDAKPQKYFGKLMNIR
jgi:hypothetical protein